MNQEIITKLEDYIFKHKTKPSTAASMMADLIGVMIGVKPSTIGHFEVEEFSNIDPDEIFELLNQAGLKALFFKQECTGGGKLIWGEYIYISRDLETAEKMHQAFVKLRSTMDDLGQIFNKEAWEESSREIGHLLGYPATATEYFIAEQDIDNEERRQLMERYQFYIHSLEHHEQEYQSYDHKIYQAISDYAPKTSNILAK